MLEPLGKSLSKIIDERLSNPLVVSFIFAWCGWNYKFIVLLFSKTPAIATFELIGTELYPYWTDYVFTGIVFPLATTLAYIYGLPFLSKPVNDYWRKKQQTDRENRQKYEDQRLVTHEEYREIKKKNQELEAANEKLTDERDEASRTAKEAFKSKQDAEDLAKTAQAEAQAATDRYNNIKNALDAARQERDRSVDRARNATVKFSEMHSFVERLRSAVPPFNNGIGGMRNVGERQDELLMWYLKDSGVIGEPFSQTMLSVLSIIEINHPVGQQLVLNMASNVMSTEAALKALRTLLDTGYIQQTGSGALDSEPYYSMTDRGAAVIKTAAEYLNFFEEVSPGNTKPDGEAKS